ncbi:MAG: OmpA family protein [Alphaproteobacteria bacterium]
MAALPPAKAPDKTPAKASPAPAITGDSLRLTFTTAKAELKPEATERLTALAARLMEGPEMRVQLKAYAAGTAETASQARRLSLSRALAVRSFLIAKGVESTRMDVRALGTKFEEGPPDRVDILIVKR